LYVGPMDATLVEVASDGRVRFENEEWRAPTLQERRAILYAAGNAIEDLKDLIEILQPVT
jgi:acyl-CoA reductase-like NAD-dependent aldehyde dehydrogenase